VIQVFGPLKKIEVETKPSNNFRTVDRRQFSAADFYKILVSESVHDVIFVRERPLAAEIDIALFTTIEEALITSKGLKIDGKCL
jgi:hypothetical protein